MHAVGVSSDPGPSPGARRATEDASGLPPPIPTGCDSEVVPRARRRAFSNADKRRILQTADLRTRPGEVGALLRREGVSSSSLSSLGRQREAADLAAVAPQKRGPKAEPARIDALQIAQLTRGRDPEHLQPLRRGLAHRTARCSKLARQLIADTVARHDVEPGMLTLHADRGAALRFKPVARLLVAPAPLNGLANLQGGFGNTDTKNLQVFAQAVREHLEQTARVVAAIWALVTPHKEKSWATTDRRPARARPCRKALRLNRQGRR